MPVLKKNIVTHEQNSSLYIELNLNGLGHAIVMVIASVHDVHVNESVRIKALKSVSCPIKVLGDLLVATKNDIAEMVTVKVEKCLNTANLRIMVECYK